MPAKHPMPDPIRFERPSGRPHSPFMTSPRSPTWEMVGALHEPQDPPREVIREAIWAALDELAYAEAYGSESDVEAAHERLARYQRVADRHNREEDDQFDEAYGEPIDEWSDVVWLDDAEDEHGA